LASIENPRPLSTDGEWLLFRRAYTFRLRVPKDDDASYLSPSKKPHNALKRPSPALGSAAVSRFPMTCVIPWDATIPSTASAFADVQYSILIFNLPTRWHRRNQRHVLSPSKAVDRIFDFRNAILHLRGSLGILAGEQGEHADNQQNPAETRQNLSQKHKKPPS
jgi:hypothetical protein